MMVQLKMEYTEKKKRDNELSLSVIEIVDNSLFPVAEKDEGIIS